MENYVGKICPFCKTAITADDEVMVCPSCATPHHKACWDENKGCTTFGCSEQHYVAQGTNPTDVCKKCGAALGDGQDFCPKCGTPKNAPDNTVCSKCGAEIMAGQEFCPKCGQKVGLAVDSGVSSAIAQFNEKQTKKNKKKVIIPVVIVGILVAGGIAIYSIMKIPHIDSIDLTKETMEMKLDETETVPYVIHPNDAGEVEITWKSSNEKVALVDDHGKIEAVGAGSCTITVEAGGKSDSLTVSVKAIDVYLSLGDYQSAYGEANDTEKKDILLENMIAFVAKDIPDSLKDPGSFSLRDAWFNRSKKEMVLYVSGANSYGATASSYWYYTYDDDDKEYQLYVTLSDLEDEEVYSWDDASDTIEKYLKNAARDDVKEIIGNSSYKLSKDGVKNINHLFEEDLLDDVDLLQENK